MILIITHKQDYTADFLINRLNERTITYKRFNCEDLLQNPFLFEFNKHGRDFSFLGCKKFNSVWFRRTKLPDFAALPIAEALYIQRETESFIKGMFAIIGGKWLSDPFAVYKAEYKLYQLKVAAECGFEIPETLITNDKTKLLSFLERNKNGTIIKPIDQTRIDIDDGAQFIYTNRLNLSDVSEADTADLTPCIYQEYIDKSYELRVTVVDGEIFCAATDSQSNPETGTDWRRKHIPFRKETLPTDVANKCKVLVEILGLNFGAIDMIKTADNRYVFLEINPNGQWAWIESETGLPIADAIINFLNCKNGN